jgi:hypothetical protein
MPACGQIPQVRCEVKGTVLLTVAVSLLIMLHVTGAVADVTMSPDPSLKVEYGTTYSDFGVTLVVSGALQPTDAEFKYTASDKDTISPHAPPPPMPPYTPFLHTDWVAVDSEDLVNLDSGWCTGYMITSPAGWVDGAVTTTAHLYFNNQTGNQQDVRIDLAWVDQGEEVPVPRTGSTLDASNGPLCASKYIHVQPR